MSFSNNLYDVKKYTDKELLDILNLSNPSDRELEAKILHMIWKYENMNKDGSINEFVRFFKDVYDHFFETENEDEYDAKNNANIQYIEEKEGFSNINAKNNENFIAAQTTKPVPAPISIFTPQGENQNEEPRQMQYAFPVEYSKDNLNPLLKQTIKRNIIIDSQYRESKSTNTPTNFTFNLSEPLKDVVSLKLYSFQIPYTWYTINNNYGSNFFYLKGNSPGINGGDKDIKIEIPVGNYTSKDLISTVNDGMLQIFRTSYSDISFGATMISYNNSNSKSTFTIDINNNYDESYYQLRFADPNLASFLGFKSAVYSPTRISSNIIFDYNIKDYALTTKNNFFSIINYLNSPQNEYFDNSTNSIILNTITIKLTLPTENKYTRTQLYNDLVEQIRQTKELCYSSITLKETPNGNYFELNLKTDRHYLDTTQNSKKVVVFPKDIDNRDHEIWVDNDTGQSAFSFINPKSNDIYANNGHHYYVELSSIISEKTIVNAEPYNLGGLTREIYLDFSSNNSKLNNNVNFKIKKDLTNPIYNTIDDYITSINNDLISYVDDNNNINNYYDNSGVRLTNGIMTILSNTGIQKDANIRANLNLQFKYNVINQENYTITLLNGTSFTNYIHIMDILPESNGNYVIEPGIPYKFYIDDPNYVLVNNQKIMTIKNTTDKYHTSIGCEIIDIFYSNAYGTNFDFYSTNEYMNEIASNIFNSNYKDLSTNTINNILNGSSYEIQSNEIINGRSFQTGIITFNINRFLTQNDYALFFVDTFADMVNYNGSNCFTDPKNSWGNYLNYYSGTAEVRNNFDSKSNPYDAMKNSNILKHDTLMGNYVSITGEEPTIDIEFTTDLPKNYIYIEPLSDVSGGEGLLVDDNTINIDLSLNVGTKYGYYKLLSIITNKINENTVSKNTTFSAKITDGNINTKLRFNINKTYTSDDYVLAFYDPYYFTTCTFNRSVQNTKWDATLGWIMGYRKNTQYALKDYVTGPNMSIATLTGDTVVNVNLYNYFMIVLDDYNQNHLNDGLVTTSKKDTSISLPSYTNRATFTCDASGNPTTSTISATGDNNLTQKQIYAAQEIINSNNSTYQHSIGNNHNYYSSGPFTNDLFAVIPLKLSGLQNNGTYVDYGGSLQNQERVYFGPVNINRMNIKLINDRGEIVDLNNNDWSFSLICEQLYQQKKL